MRAWLNIRWCAFKLHFFIHLIEVGEREGGGEREREREGGREKWNRTEKKAIREREKGRINRV